MEVYPVVVGVVVVVTLRAADAETVLVEAHPQVGAERVAVGAHKALQFRENNSGSRRSGRVDKTHHAVQHVMLEQVVG